MGLQKLPTKNKRPLFPEELLSGLSLTASSTVEMHPSQKNQVFIVLTQAVAQLTALCKSNQLQPQKANTPRVAEKQLQLTAKCGPETASINSSVPELCYQVIVLIVWKFILLTNNMQCKQLMKAHSPSNPLVSCSAPTNMKI